MVYVFAICFDRTPHPAPLALQPHGSLHAHRILNRHLERTSRCQILQHVLRRRRFVGWQALNVGALRNSNRGPDPHRHGLGNNLTGKYKRSVGNSN
jgi:hypothetical protein